MASDSGIPRADEASLSSLCPQSLTAARIFRQRRSCLALDGRTSLPREAFFAILRRTLPDANCSPWETVPWHPRLHLGVFVHRVDALPPGLYFLARRADELPRLREALSRQFRWLRPEGCPVDLPLFLLHPADVTRIATQVSCHQDIAGDGCFSLGMLAEWSDHIPYEPPWAYRRLHWEADLIGQVLYLEAEAAGLRGSGMGCYFDDPVHELFGIPERQYQSLYHFTIGGFIDDERLTTLPPYPQRRRSG